MQRKET